MAKKKARAYSPTLGGNHGNHIAMAGKSKGMAGVTGGQTNSGGPQEPRDNGLLVVVGILGAVLAYIMAFHP